MKNSRFVIEGYRRLWWLWTYGGWRVAHSVMCTTTAGGPFVRKPDVFLSISRHAYQEGFAIAGPHTAENWACKQRLTNATPAPYSKRQSSCLMQIILLWKHLNLRSLDRPLSWKISTSWANRKFLAFCGTRIFITVITSSRPVNTFHTRTFCGGQSKIYFLCYLFYFYTIIYGKV